ncbi:MAG: two-component sensor histidine kinase [Crocinitomix sp.]|jgi:two-component sensor histidine kinase
MSLQNDYPAQNKFTLAFEDKRLEQEFRKSYDKSVRLPLRYGIIISILSWYSGLYLIYAIIPEQFSWLAPLTLISIGVVFGLIVYTTYKARFRGYYHNIGAFSNAWGGLFAIYFCDQFPGGESLTLPVLIFIIFFGSYMIRLRWIAGFVAALSYVLGYHIYILIYSDLSGQEILVYAFVAWMTLIFAILAGRVAEANNRLAYTQSLTIKKQRDIIEHEKEVLLKEVHHRVKNNLQIIVSLINLQIMKLDNKEIEEALKETQGRVMSMSLVHHRIRESSNFTEILLKEYAKELISRSQQVYKGEPVTFDLDIADEIKVDIETAIPLGLIINEIATNFFKHCHPVDGEKRTCFLHASIDAENNYHIKCSDNGTQFPTDLDMENIETLGLELIHSLTDQIDGYFDFYNENGVVYEINFKP